MSKPPKIVIPGLNRGIGVPPGYVLGRMPGSGNGPAQLLNMGSLRKLGVAGASGVAQSTSTAISTAHSENISLKTSVSTSLSQISSSLSGAVSSTGSLSTAVSTVISGSISAVNSRIDSLSTAGGGGGGGGVDDDSGLSTSLSQVSSSLSGAISSTSSLSTAVSTVDSNQSTSLSQISSSLSAEISTDLSRINSLSTAVGTGSVAVPGTIKDLLYWFEPSNILASSGAALQVMQNLCPWYPGFFATINGSGGTTAGATIDSSTLNSLPVINTVGTSAARYSWFSAATAANLLNNVTVFTVFKPNSIANTVAQAFISGAANSFEFRISGTGVNVGTLEILQAGIVSIATATAGSISAGTWYQTNVTYASGSGAYAFRIAQATAGSGTNAKPISAANFGIFYNQVNTAEDLNCKLAALIVYNRVLSGAEIIQVETYLNTKYGV